MESLKEPHFAEMVTEEDLADAHRLLEEARDIPTERIVRMLSGEEDIGLNSKDDLMEVLLRRQFEEGGYSGDPVRSSSALFIVCFVIVLLVFAYFGWNLYKYLMDKERKREEKKKMKQRKKK